MIDKRYCLVVDGTITKYNLTQKQTGLGVNTSIDVYLAKGFYPLEDNAPTIDSTTQRISGKSFEVLSDKVVCTYTIVDIPLEELQAKKVEEVTNTIDTFIQSKINEYNTANGTLFKDINSISKYLIDTNYSHYAFCNAIIKWNIQVWETARSIQADVLAGNRAEPTDITLELPELVY